MYGIIHCSAMLIVEYMYMYMNIYTIFCISKMHYDNFLISYLILFQLTAKKVPILIFSGDNEGVIIKWERMQSNHFMYRYVYSETILICTN